MGKTTTRARLRRLAMGAATLLGRPLGFFAPYRHADSVPRPPDAPGYPAVAAVLAGAATDFEAVRDAIAAHAPRLATMAGPAPSPRLAQRWFCGLDAGAAYALVRDAPPARIVEVGSGHSTRFLAQALADAGARAEHLCVDPAPRAALPAGVRHLPELLAPAHVELFAALEPGDVAFFDSSHVLWPHGDVDLILNHVLPALAQGVRVHVHDVFLPDPYPADWGWRGYAEQVGLAPWLLSGAFRPLFSSRWAATRMPKRSGLAAVAPPPGCFESSLWMTRA